MSINSSRNFDIVVVGGGLAGLTAALALSNNAKPAKIALVVPKRDRIDGRTTALLGQSVDYLNQLGVWQECAGQAAPLSIMRILDGTSRLWRAPPVEFKARELGRDAFGYNITNSILADALMTKIELLGHVHLIEDSISGIEFSEDTTLLEPANSPTIAAKLVIAADGRNSLLRQQAGISTKTWQYPQSAIAVNFAHGHSHNNTSTEFHTEEGPFTIVPLATGNKTWQSGLVWVMRPENCEKFLTQDKPMQEKLIEQKMQSMLGKVELVSSPQQFPLSGMVAKQQANNRVALVGDAAHVFPPIGAQGFNLGLRDVREICDLACGALNRFEDPGGAGVISRYNSKRWRDITSRTGAVDALNRSLLTDFLPVQAVRGLGLFALAQIPALRKFAMRQGMSLSGTEKPHAA